MGTGNDRGWGARSATAGLHSVAGGPQPTLPCCAAVGSDASEAPPCLVACSGEGKSGMLTVLRRSVVPDVITEVPLTGILGAWAVHHSTGGGAAAAPGGDQHHAYLLLSFPGATKVLATGEELQEITET